MPINPHFHISKFKKGSIKLFLIVLLTASLFIAIYNFNYTPIRGHSPLAYPKEIYSLYNSTILPNLDGKIEFNGTDASIEWASAAVYDMYDNLESPRGKVFLQNDDSYLYIGFDMIDYEVEDPATAWGAGIVFDLNHNGILDTSDRYVSVMNEVNDTLHVDIYRGLSNGQWDLLATDTTGVEIPTYNVTVDMDYSKSFFDSTNSHRQYEFKIDLDTLNKNPGDLFGIGFAATNIYSSGTGSITWPYTDDSSTIFRTTANCWGDIYLGENGVYTKYVIEDNFNIKDGAIGTNNGTFLSSGDINGDGDLELIVSSNRTVSVDTNLIAIYDTVDGEITQIWNSWTSTHKDSLFLTQGIACYDFTGDGEDEIYMASTEDSRILRLKDWNDVSGDFDTLDLAFDNVYNTMGYIAIGDATNDGNANILIGDSDTTFTILEYDKEFKPFTQWNDAWYIAPDINSSSITKIHAVEIAESDHDSWNVNEILLLSQFSADDSVSSTGLQIFELTGTSIYDNPTADPTYGYEDDLPISSHSNTFDSFGHTIIVADVDNDGIHETIIVGKDYLKIFGHDTFNDTTIPLVLDINDETYPSMGGGAGVFDIDGDSYNELIVGCNNGTTFVYQIVDLNPDDAIEDLFVITEWKGDLGTMPGKRGSIIGLDIDGDGAEEAFIGDQFGQIIVLGLGELPSFSITSPIEGYTTGQNTILFEWETSNDSLPIVFYDIYINAKLSLRVGGAQTGAVIPLESGSNVVNIVCTDIRGETDSDSRSVIYNAGAPTIDITSPENGFLTDLSSITIYWDAYDPQSDDLTFEVYANGTDKGTTSLLQHTFSFDSEGTWNITVIATDGSDRVKDMIYVTYDNTGPVIAITSPADNSFVSSSLIQLKWSAYDEHSSIDYYEIYRDGELQGNTTTKYYDVDLPFEKEYTLVVLAYDILGKTGSDSIQVTRDTIDPSVSLESLSYPVNDDGWFVTDLADVFIEWNGNDTASGSGIDYFEVLINGEQFSNYTSTEVDDTITLTEEGGNNVKIVAYDMAGNFASDYFIIAYDVSNPQVTITSPENNYLTSAENVTVFWDASDIGSGIKEIVVIVDSFTVATFTDPTINSYFVDISETKIYTITIRVTDFLDNFAEDTINVEHDPISPILIITNPLAESSYINSTFVEVTWETININPDSFIVFINGTDYPYTNTTFDTIINLEDVFGLIDENTYPIANITVVAVIGGQYQFFDTKYVIVDLKNPVVAIISPLNFATISDDSVVITWSGSDIGSDISSYTLWVNDTLIDSWDKTITVREIDVESYTDGVYMIILEGRDFAGNAINSTIYINLFPSEPEFTLDISASVITNDPNFPVTISITNPSSGIQEVFVLADNSEIVYYINYNESYRVDPFDVIVNVEEVDFVAPSNEHNLTITIYDRGGRSATTTVDIIIDKENPYLFNPIIDSTLLGPSGYNIEISENRTDVHNFTVSTTDNSGIQQVNLLISNENHTFSYQMAFNAEHSTSTVFVFDISVNFDDYSAGIYSIQFLITDNAGNTLSQSFSLVVSIEQQQIITTPPPTTPGGSSQWLMDNLFTIVIPSAAGLLLMLILATIITVVARKRGGNRGWRDVIKAVAYVTKTGLTVAYIQYAEDLYADEQLFGGALTGIVGILGEITGEEEVTMKVQTIEYGGKRLLVCSGIFGNAILLVSEAKPILKDLLKNFILEFELTYKHTLAQDMLNLNDYDAAPLMVESYFGARSEDFRNSRETPSTEESADQNANDFTFTEEPVREHSEELSTNAEHPTETLAETIPTEEVEHVESYENDYDSLNDSIDNSEE